MHAASVHPEPGSNSRKIYIISTLRWLQSFFELFILASFTLLSIYNSYRRDLHLHFFALYLSLVVQFSMTIAIPFCGTARILYHIRKSLSSTFLKVFQKTFSSTRHSSQMSVPRFGRLAYYTTFIRVCQGVF